MRFVRPKIVGGWKVKKVPVDFSVKPPPGFFLVVTYGDPDPVKRRGRKEKKEEDHRVQQMMRESFKARQSGDRTPNEIVVRDVGGLTPEERADRWERWKVLLWDALTNPHAIEYRAPGLSPPVRCRCGVWIDRSRCCKCGRTRASHDRFEHPDGPKLVDWSSRLKSIEQNFLQGRVCVDSFVEVYLAPSEEEDAGWSE